MGGRVKGGEGVITYLVVVAQDVNLSLDDDVHFDGFVVLVDEDRVGRAHQGA